MTNSERLLRELRQAGRRGCTHRELEGSGVAYISVEVGRLRARGAVIREDRLRVSGQKRFVLIVEPGVGRVADQASRPVGDSPGTGRLFDPPTRQPAGPYDDVEAA